MIEAHAALQQELQTERTNVDRQREEMKTERRQLAQQRTRNPIVAQAIRAVGLTLACLAPLALAAYVIYSLNHSSDDNDALSELLVLEITAEKPGAVTFTRSVGVTIHRTRAEVMEP